MPNPFFRFKQFTIFHDRCAMKVTTDGCLFGAWVADQLAGKPAQKALDIGTGTGLLSLMVAQKTAHSIDAVEIDTEAAAQAADNIAAAPWADRIRLHVKSFLDFKVKEAYDVIFSNPPFYESELISDKRTRNIAHHGEGLRLEALLTHAGTMLKEEGDLYLLLPSKREQEIDLLIRRAGLFILHKIMVCPTPAHLPIRLLLHIGKRKAADYATTMLYIRERNNEYSEAFIKLLHSYYLYL